MDRSGCERKGVRCKVVCRGVVRACFMIAVQSMKVREDERHFHESWDLPRMLFKACVESLVSEMHMTGATAAYLRLVCPLRPSAQERSSLQFVCVEPSSSSREL